MTADRAFKDPERDQAKGPSESFKSADQLEPLDYIRRATLERIEHFLLKPKLGVYRDLKGMCERVSEGYRDRVVLELLQNAHDAHPPGLKEGRVRIALNPTEGEHGTLHVANDGHGFTEQNFDALCRPTLTTKNVNEAIGNKGVGFLSVFQVSSHPEVFSRRPVNSTEFDGFCFAFATDETLREFLNAEALGDRADEVIANMPRLYLACPLRTPPAAVEQFASDGFATVVSLPLKSNDALAAVQRQLAWLCSEEPPVQLFLPRIRELSVSTCPDKPPVVLERDCETVEARGETRILRAHCGTHSFIVAERTVPYATVIDIIRRDIAAERLPETWEEWTGDAVASAAVTTNGDPLEPRLYNFLPMGEAAEAPFAGYLDAPFFASLDRQRVQGGVELNSFFFETARKLAIDAAELARESLPRIEARHVALDFVLWTGDEEMRERVLSSTHPLVPTISMARRNDDWAQLRHAKIWAGDEFLSPSFVARYSNFPIVDPKLGQARLRMLRSFVEGTGFLQCSSTTRAAIVEHVASALPRPPRGLERWNQFYRSVAELFRNDASSLAGRLLLLNQRGELQATQTNETIGAGRRRRRLSATFLPPLRGASDHVAISLPKAVQRRLTLMHGDLELAVDGSSAARRFLLASGLVREHDSREILRLLASAIIETGDSRDPEALRWEALTAMMRIVTAEDTADGVVGEINPLVPTREGWSRASTAYFSAKWPETRGSDLERLFERAAGISTELDQHGARLLRRYSDWPVPPNERDNWVRFLKKAGVVDIMRPVPLFTGPTPREWPAHLQGALAERSGLPALQRDQWIKLMGNGWAVTNPQTLYTAVDLVRLPGQVDYDALRPVVAGEYATQLIRLIDATPECLRFTIYRPLHSHQPNRRSWPSPIAAFIRSEQWIPLTTGRTVDIGKVWLPVLDSRTPPPLLPIASIEFRQELARHPDAADALRAAGLAEYGTKKFAWRFLVAAGNLVASETAAPDSERLLAAAQDSWQHVDLDLNPPTGLKLLGRCGGMVISSDPRASDAPPFLVADGDDRQMVAASARAEPATIILEPPTSRAKEIGAYLARHFPETVHRASAIEAQYECEGQLIVPDPADPRIDETFGDQVRQIVALTLRYRSSFYRGNVDETLAKLTTIRTRKLRSLFLRIGNISEPVPRFEERAVLLGGSAFPTILYSEALASSDHLLVGLAPAIGAALGAQRIVGEPLLAFSAELGGRALESTYEDYAAVLNVPVEDIKGVLGASRASIANLLRTLRPLVALFVSEDRARQFAPGSGLVTEADVIRELETVRDYLPIGPKELVQRCRESDLAGIALSLRIDLAKLNARLEELGPPYEPINLTDRHAATLASFLNRNESLVRESIRQRFRHLFEAGQDLSEYVAARGAARPALPDDYGYKETELTQSRMQHWLDVWLNGIGVKMLSELPGSRSQLESVRDANLKQLRSLVPELRTAILARTPADTPIRRVWMTIGQAEEAVTKVALSRGWLDFDRLNERDIMLWLTRAGLWPQNWPILDGLAVTEAERAARRQQDERDRIAATAVKRQMQYTGGTFTFGEDAMGSLADQISALVANNAELLNTSARTVTGDAPNLRQSGGGGGHGNGGGKTQTKLTDDERSLVGFFGEAIAFEWLKRRFSGKRIVDETCWKSAYRQHVCGEPGDDSLGYDFELMNGLTRWLFEVKSTTAPGPAKVQSLEIGSSELRCAEACKSDRRVRYRILYVTDALHPEKAMIFPLPNPRSRRGLAFYTDADASHRLYFPLKP